MLKNQKMFNIDHFYKEYLKGPKLFKSREALQSSYIPEELPHRDTEIEEVARITACALKGDTPPNILCYGMTGTGKTATVRYISQKLAQHCLVNKPWWVYINCNVLSTPYRILAHLYNTITGQEKIPPTGLPKDVIFKNLLGLLDYKIGKSVCFLVLDEIDILMEKGGKDTLNEILYDLTRLNENLDVCRTALIGISNKINFTENLDPRVQSSLGNVSVNFPTYNATQLRDILNDRSRVAFYDDVIKDDVIPLCAAFAAKENGDARKALELLRKAGELAERGQLKFITEKHVHEAFEELEKDYIVEFIKGMPFQTQLTLTAIFLLSKFSPKHIIISGDIYDVYEELCSKIPGLKQVSKRRVSDFINQLAQAGIISADVRSMGRYGRTKIIKFEIEMDLIEKVLMVIPKIKNLLDIKPVRLQSDKVKFNDNVFKKII
ncbi:MAG: Cdc6/Cdc18 family protein [Promethearchaeota archaeon]